MFRVFISCAPFLEFLGERQSTGEAETQRVPADYGNTLHDLSEQVRVEAVRWDVFGNRLVQFFQRFNDFVILVFLQDTAAL